MGDKQELHRFAIKRKSLFKRKFRSMVCPSARSIQLKFAQNFEG